MRCDRSPGATGTRSGPRLQRTECTESVSLPAQLRVERFQRRCQLAGPRHPCSPPLRSRTEDRHLRLKDLLPRRLRAAWPEGPLGLRSLCSRPFRSDSLQAGTRSKRVSRAARANETSSSPAFGNRSPGTLWHAAVRART
jgi:hypothetical protein